MENKQLKNYQGIIVAFLFLFLFFVPIPRVISIIIIWFIVFLIANIFGGSGLFAAFISTAFAALLIVFVILRSSEPKNLRKIFIENFEGEEKSKNDENDEKVLNDNLPEVKEIEPKKLDIDVKLTDVVQEPKPEKKISMMDQDIKENEDVFGKIDLNDLEDSDEDSDKEADEDDLKPGTTKVSSKQAYKAQKQLYDLTMAVDKLHNHMEQLSGPLKKGQKIIDSLEKFGISKFA